jgi:acyl-homoserine-lactone acylase
VTRQSLEASVLDSRSMSEALFRKPLVEALCVNDRASANGARGSAGDTVMVAPAGASVNHAADEAQPVDLRGACEVLRVWDGTARTRARGANLWDEFWRCASTLPPERLYRVPFDPNAPLATPRGLNVDDPVTVEALRQAFGGAVLALRRYGFETGSARGDLLYTRREDEPIPLYGGCSEGGYFTVVCPQHPLDAGGYSMDRNGHGNSYVQVVGFGAQGVEADTLLAHSQSDDPASAHFPDATRQFARQSWLRFPFTEDAIARDPALMQMTLQGTPVSRQSEALIPE